ncbi:ArnT family glycosyltransferase [Thermodesulfobacteriota bacterium]
MNQKNLGNIAAVLLCITILLFVVIEFILNLTPPISRDALIHHLAVPKLWLKHGGFYETPWANYSYYPMYINLLYLACLYFKNDIVPKFVHLAFGLGTGVLIYIYLKQKLDRNWGLLGMVIFLTTPIVVWLSTSAYIDLGMTFFTTASILALVRWRELEYRHTGWLLISAFCMGIAVGSKYNALIAWFIVNLLLVIIYVRETKHQTAAVKYGLMFFAITALVASPWYMKNYLLTGNPFHPMFHSAFKSLQQQPIQKVLQSQAARETGKIGFFQMRKIMYGENFWETLLIPIRMFFQGEDNSYRYFQGVLNPILIIFSPFIILNRRFHHDKILFVLFSVIFIFMAYFLTEKQVRYILPTIPFLTILAVVGIKNLSDMLRAERFFPSYKYTGRVAGTLLLGVVVLLLSLNAVYLKNRIAAVNPFPFVFGEETRDDYLSRHLLHYPAVRYINQHLPDNASLFLMLLGRRGYYLERSYKSEPSFGRNTLNRMVFSSVSEKRFKGYVRSIGATHIFMRSELVDRHLRDNFSQEEIKRFMTLTRKLWKPLFEYNGHAVWAVQGK